MGGDVPTGPVGPAQVELRLAGTFCVVRDGTELSDGEVGSRKSRTLLKLLAVERPGLVSVDRIVDVLWAEGAPAAAEQNVATLVSRLRGVLGAGVILGGRQGYRLAGGPAISVDLDEAARLCDQAERKLPVAAAVALAVAERAIELLSVGTALADEQYAAWADPARTQVRALSRRARLAAAEAALAAGDAPAAMRHSEGAMAADPLDEAAHRWYMSASAAAGEPARALAAYARLQERLGEELGVDPAPQTRELHLAILREEGGGRSAGPGRGPAQVPAAGRGGPGGRTLTRGGPVLAGRDGEIAALRDAWGRAAGGEAAIVMIVGEAGIGKTALANVIGAEAAQDAATVLQARCYEAERSLFLQPVVEAVTPTVVRLPAAALRELLGGHAPAAAGLLPDVAALLGPQPAWRGSADMERRRAFEAMTALLSGLAARSPVLLLLDDLQYAGQSSVEFMHYLARHCAGSRLLAVVTVRAENEADIGAALAPVAARVDLGPLGLAAVEQLARAAGQGGLAESILERTRGHTLFVVEVLRALAAGDAGVPETLRNAIQARVRRTGTAAEALLRAASVLGAALDPLVLSDLLSLAPAAVLELCALALEARLLVVSGRDYEFANDLVREVLYASTAEPVRLAYHRRAADLLADRPESLGRHAAAAGDWPRAARAWLVAAENAMRRYAATDAAALATQALDAAERAGDPEVAPRALVLRGRAHDVAGALDAAFTDLSRAAEAARVAGDSRLEMRALGELGRSRPWKVHTGTPISYYTTNLTSGLRIAESLGDRASEADLLSRLTVISANQLRLDAALDYGLRAVSAARASADEDALAAGLDGLKTAYLNLGDVRGLAAVLAELRPLLRRLGDLFRLQWAEFETAFGFIAAADWDRAAAAMESAIAVNRRGGYPHFAAWYTAHLGWLARLRGRDDEAVTLGRRALALTEEHEHAWWQAAACALLGTAVLQRGDRAEAIGLFQRGLAAAEDVGAEAYLLRCAAPLAVATGSPAVLADADRLLDQAGIPAGGAWLLGEEAYLALARAWLGQGEPERARAVLAPLLALAESGPWLPTLAATLAADGRALVRLGEADPARQRLLRAERLAREHGLPHVRRDAESALRSLGSCT